MLSKLLFKPVDNSALIVFRICFGLLITLESWGAIATGWVKRVLVEPKFTFNFIGLDFLQYLQGPFMYVWFVVMGIFGIGVMLGYKYRFSIIGFTLFWLVAYLMQKSAYNNHYYLLVLLSLMMCFMPAHQYKSLDVKQNQSLKSLVMPNWVNVLIITQLAIVYTYAALAKIYPDWINTEVIAIFMKSKANYFLIGEMLQQKWIHYGMAYFGIAFDLLIVPLLLWSKTRKFAFGISLFFHLFNSIVFQIGIFPYMSLAFTVFFFPVEVIRKRFLPRKPSLKAAKQAKEFSKKPVLVVGLVFWILIQLILPVRHHFINSDVFWSEEGHRMSWRMMLRAKSSFVRFKIKDLETQQIRHVNLDDYLTKKQQRSLGKPDVFWQFTQHLKQNLSNQNMAIYATAWVKLNQHARRYLVSPDLDLTSIKWQPFKTNRWLLLKD
ncbi:HTTM domain-containing protein [Psychroflexus sp. ALD_RP9]|uniref:HTTM domain-containing protein n=1 Tax=Psychroflexus sp. ALD_RP9 TaxID=2777186 RepID=UPI001A90B1E6|nr:HTTM domain-containing protein [Psychroflexus sp. ALD_RP9]QSS96211.1 HTTM domain-containing protein [Psychroflexus sp. ALD_RP9]